MPQSTSRTQIEEASSEEAPRRRRSGRKRKRRPVPTSAEEGSIDGFKYSDEQGRPHFDDFSNERQTSETPKRRRKKIQRKIKWADSIEEDRPTRRTKQPRVETWPELSEFDDYRPNQAPQNVDEEATTDQIMTMNEDEHGDDFRSTQKLFQGIFESREDVDTLKTKNLDNEKDKSVSEFSPEDYFKAGDRKLDMHEKMKDKMPQYAKQNDKAQV